MTFYRLHLDVVTEDDKELNEAAREAITEKFRDYAQGVVVPKNIETGNPKIGGAAFHVHNEGDCAFCYGLYQN